MNWRRVRQDMEHEHYQQLRRDRHAGVLSFDVPDEVLRQRAFDYATESCRSALARYRDRHG